jgi:YD repeat-containing protein
VQTVHDAAGNGTSMTDPLGHHTSLCYDASNRLLSTTNPNNLTTSFTYDNVGDRRARLIRSVEPPRFDYDALNRVAGD